MALPARPAAVLFDLDGLLFDTERLYRDAILSAADADGLALGPDLFHRMLGCPWQRNRQMLMDHFGPAFDVDLFHAAWIRHFERLIDAGPYVKPGVEALLDLLDRLALPRAIATSSTHRGIQRHLGAHGLTGRFPVLVGFGDYAAGKPAPDPFLAAARRLGVDPGACLALEDSFNGVRSAAAAGTMTVMVPDLLPPSDEIRALCTAVVPDLHAVRDLLLAAAA